MRKIGGLWSEVVLQQHLTKAVGVSPARRRIAWKGGYLG